MGACTSKKSVTAVAPLSKSEINQSAHEHLKNLQHEDPLASSVSSEAFNSTLKKMQK